MACPRCGGRMKWEDRSYTGAGIETPAHWSCISCGEIVWPDKVKPIETKLPDPKTVNKQEEKSMVRKLCNKCKKEKEVDEFHRNASTSDGYQRTCRQCMHIIQAEIRARKKARGDGRRISKPGYHKPPAGRKPPPPPAPAPVGEALYIDPAAIRALKRGVGKDLLREFARFLEERYA